MYDVVALGELLIDFASVSKDGEGYPTMAAHPGGAPANVLAAVNKFGGKTALIGKVGDDTFGHLLLNTLEGAGIDTRGMRVAKDFFTTLAFVTFDEKGDRSFAFSRKPGADTQLSFDEIDLGMIDETKVFHFGTLSLTHEPARSATYRTVEYAKNARKLISFDPNLREPLWPSLEEAKKQILWGIEWSDIIKISDGEVDFLWHIPPEEGAQKIIHEYGAKLVSVTCGAKGSFLSNQKHMVFLPSLDGLQVCDTTGAGDIYAASIIWNLIQENINPEDLSDDDLQRIAKFATVSAGLSTTKAGAITSIPSLQDILLY